MMAGNNENSTSCESARSDAFEIAAADMAEALLAWLGAYGRHLPSEIVQQTKNHLHDTLYVMRYAARRLDAIRIVPDDTRKQVGKKRHLKATRRMERMLNKIEGKRPARRRRRRRRRRR